MLLTATTESLEVNTSSTASTDYSTHFADHTTTTLTPGTQQGNITTATNTAIVAAPGGSTQRQILHMIVTNLSTTASQTVYFRKVVSGTPYRVSTTFVLQPGYSLIYTKDDGFTLYDNVGRKVVVASSPAASDGYSQPIYKIGSTAESAGIWHSLHAATGNPGAWAPGTPGIAGRTTDGTTVADGGCIPLKTPAAGYNYLVGLQAQATIVNPFSLVDYMWVNTGTGVTTITAQTVNSVAWPARDIDGSTNGRGVYVAILVTTATTNAGAITNMTMSYTNSDGTAGRTATIGSFPGTAVAGTMVWFQLATGDMGVRSIQSLTLGTSLVTGAVSLIAGRVIASVGNSLVNNLGHSGPLRRAQEGGGGVRLWPGTCLIPAYIAAATTGATFSGLATIEVR